MELALLKLNQHLEATHWWFRARREILFRLGEAVLRDSGGLVVDVGCGTGGVIARFASSYAAVGFDISEESVKLSRESHPDVTFHHLDRKNKVDDALGRAALVLLNDVLEHIEDDKGFMRRLISSVKTGCCLLITVPADMRLWGRHDEVHGHFRRYDKASLEDCFRQLPVSCALISYFNSRLYLPVRLIRSISRCFRFSLGPVGSDLVMPVEPLNSMLSKIFMGESRRLVACLNGKGVPYRVGVSLVAVLKKGG